MLKRKRAIGHPVAHDGFHSRLTECTARLFVGKYVAHRRHLRGEVGQILVRIVDDAEPLVQDTQAVHCVARRLLHRLPDAMGY